MMLRTCLWLCILPLVLSEEVLPDEHDLLLKIFDGQSYDSSVRPVFNSSKNVVVSFGFTLIQIMDMDEKNQVLVTNVWLEMIWKDERIQWDKDNYNGLEVVRLPALKLWLPDIVLYNNADDYTSGFMKVNAMVHHDGTISWGPPVRFKSSCKVDITYFPFDHQICKLKFGSWTYDKAQVDMVNKTYLVDVSGYVTNGEWMLIRYTIERNEVVYPISSAIYPDVTVILVIQRRILYYVLNILFPCFWLNILSVLTFCLPPDAGEKITLSITVLLSYSVFMLLVAESMPPTSEFVPLIGIYLTVSMAVASVSVILTVLVLKLHHCAPNQKRVPSWVRHYVLGFLARFVRCSCVSARIQYIHARKVRKKTKDNGVADSEASTKLLNEVESLTRNHLKIDTISGSFKNNYNRTSSIINNVSDSKINLNFKDGTLSNRSSCADVDSHVTTNRENGSNVMGEILKYLKFMMQKSDAEDDETDIVDEWKQVALVVDRLFFWLFLLLTIFSTLVLLVVVPAFKYITDEGI